jgi:hypothetical protein
LSAKDYKILFLLTKINIGLNIGTDTLKMEVVYRSGEQNSPQKIRERIPRAVLLLNGRIENVGLSPLAIEGLKKAGFNYLRDFREAVLNNSVPLTALGRQSRLEIDKLFRINKVELPPHWLWRY